MKYIFIDANQYRHLFSKNEGFSDQIKELIDKLISRNKIKLLLPQQVKDEVDRNRFEEWYKEEIETCKNKIKSLTAQMERREKELNVFPKELNSIKKKIQNAVANEEKELKQIKKRFRNLRSKANQKLKSLFDQAEIIAETPQIISAASLRFEKANPPNDRKLGDALIWESIVEYLARNAERHSSLVFVARDGDAWGYDGFNPWLVRELKEKTKVSISLSTKLSDIKDLTKDEQEGLRRIEQEELKNNAVLSFVNSGSFVSAGRNADKLIEYKDILTKDDYEKIVDASISNSQIYQSFFTAADLNYLCKGNDNYVVSHLEDLDGTKWQNFVKLNAIKLKRQIDENNEEVSVVDIPF
ncbi:MAG: PIN domain-containing protein [Candidatus Staskawiczbacteria bacterium]|nr:PIN domain-containing protein [Candidatus Staskawiczbacteria bacterium]